jgi:hypothetical protein
MTETLPATGVDAPDLSSPDLATANAELEAASLSTPSRGISRLILYS